MSELDVSVVVEWDNFKPDRIERALEAFRRLDRQVGAVGAGEIIVTFNAEEADKSDIDAFLERADVRSRPGLDVRLEGRDGIQYHLLKNAGGEVARGRLIAFVDSDVLPDDGWLPKILAPFADPSVEVVAGATYCGPLDSLWNRSFASFWRFDPRPSDSWKHRAKGFWSNNVAFRADTFARHRWPADPRIREENVDFNISLRAAGVKVVHAPRAALEHSPPGDPGHLLRYGLSDGYNRAYRWAAPGTSRRFSKLLPLALATLVSDVDRYARLIVERRRAVQLDWREVPAAMGLAICMAVATLIGVVVAPLTGDLISRRFQF